MGVRFFVMAEVEIILYLKEIVRKSLTIHMPLTTAIFELRRYNAPIMEHGDAMHVVLRKLTVILSILQRYIAMT